MIFCRRSSRPRPIRPRRLAPVLLLPLVWGCGAADRGAHDGRDSSALASGSARPAASIALTGVGATLPYPLYARWFNDYATETGVRINYRSEGSRRGIAAALDGSADFGATDLAVPDSLLRWRAQGVAHIPMAVGAVAITYHVPGVERPLRLTPELIAGLFTGTIRRWNDERLQALNPTAALPDLAVRPVFRSDGSGTASIFDQYLRGITGTGVPRRDGAPAVADAMVRDGNEAVASEVKATPGTVAYLEVVYARQNRLPAAHLRNPAGRFVSPMPYEIATAAANRLEALAPLDDEGASGFRISLLNAPGEQAYPLAAFTWLLVTPDRLSPDKRATLAAFLHWAFEEGAPTASALGYVPLPSTVASRVLARADSLLR